MPRSSRIEFTADVTVTEVAEVDEPKAVTGRRTTAYVTLERGATATGWRLVTFSLDPAP